MANTDNPDKNTGPTRRRRPRVGADVREGRLRFAALIEEQIDRSGKTVNEIADASGIPISTWSSWMRGVTDPEPRAVKRIGLALGVPTIRLWQALGWTDTEQSQIALELDASWQLQTAAESAVAALRTLDEATTATGTASIVTAALRLHPAYRALIQPVRSRGRYSVPTHDVVGFAPSSTDWTDWTGEDFVTADEWRHGLVTEISGILLRYGATARIPFGVNFPAPFSTHFTIQVPTITATRNIAPNPVPDAPLSFAVIGPADDVQALGDLVGKAWSPSTPHVIGALIADQLRMRYRRIDVPSPLAAPTEDHSDAVAAAQMLAIDPGGRGRHLVWSTTSLEVGRALLSKGQPAWPRVVVVTRETSENRIEWQKLADEIREGSASEQRVTLCLLPAVTEANPYARESARYDADVEAATELCNLVAPGSIPTEVETDRPAISNPAGSLFRLWREAHLHEEPQAPGNEDVLDILRTRAKQLKDGVIVGDIPDLIQNYLANRDQLSAAIRTPGLMEESDELRALLMLSSIHHAFLPAAFLRLTVVSSVTDRAVAQMVAGNYGGFISPIVLAGWYLTQKTFEARARAFKRVNVCELHGTIPAPRFIDLIRSTNDYAADLRALAKEYPDDASQINWSHVEWVTRED